MGASRPATQRRGPGDPWDDDACASVGEVWQGGPDGHPWDTDPDGLPAERLALVDLLDRVLAGGVVITGDITLSIADVDLVVISLRALLTSVSALVQPATGENR
jgi:hypothetical protein